MNQSRSPEFGPSHSSEVEDIANTVGSLALDLGRRTSTDAEGVVINFAARGDEFVFTPEEPADPQAVELIERITSGKVAASMTEGQAVGYFERLVEAQTRFPHKSSTEVLQQQAEQGRLYMIGTDTATIELQTSVTEADQRANRNKFIGYLRMNGITDTKAATGLRKYLKNPDSSLEELFAGIKLLPPLLQSEPVAVLVETAVAPKQKTHQSSPRRRAEKQPVTILPPPEASESAKPAALKSAPAPSPPITKVITPKPPTKPSWHNQVAAVSRLDDVGNPDDSELQDADELEVVDYLDEAAPNTDLVRAYLNEIGRVALLNAEQEVDLSMRIEAGLMAAYAKADPDRFKDYYKRYRAGRGGHAAFAVELDLLAADGKRASDHLQEANLRLVVSLAKRYQGKGLELLDLIQEGNLGLYRAVEKFDYTKGYKFSTYATWWIRQALQRSVADHGRTIRVPVHMVEQINKALRIKRDLAAEYQRDPTPAEIGAILEMTAEKVEEILSYGRETISLEAPVGDDGDAQFGDFIMDDDAPLAEDQVDFGLLQDKLGSVLGLLKKRNAAMVIRMRFGLDDGRPKTLDEVGRTLGLTRERIRQIEKDALIELRRKKETKALEAYL